MDLLPLESVNHLLSVMSPRRYSEVPGRLTLTLFSITFHDASSNVGQHTHTPIKSFDHAIRSPINAHGIPHDSTTGFRLGMTSGITWSANIMSPPKYLFNVAVTTAALAPCQVVQSPLAPNNRQVLTLVHSHEDDLARRGVGSRSQDECAPVRKHHQQWTSTTVTVQSVRIASRE